MELSLGMSERGGGGGGGALFIKPEDCFGKLFIISCNLVWVFL
jgi:hypothetical protein